MDCRTFRNRHLAFVDDTLPGVQLRAMERHLLECEACARHDSLVRRSLMLAHNLPPIEPSADFAARLAARLEREKALMAGRGDAIGRPLPTAIAGSSPWTFLAVAASLVGIGYLAAAASRWSEAPHDIALAPVIATQPELGAAPMSDPAMVASLSAGIPVWPIAYFVGQAPVRFAEMTR